MPTTTFWGDVQQWWDIPANRHSQGANLSFADGHAEHWEMEGAEDLHSGSLPQAVPGAELL